MAPASITTRPSRVDRLVDLALDAAFDRLEEATVGLEERRLLAGVDPPAAEHLGAHPVPVVDQPLDGVGDLEFAARRRFDGVDRLVDRAGRRGRRRRGRGRTAGPPASRRSGRRRRARRDSATPKWCGSVPVAAGSARPGGGRRRGARASNAIDELGEALLRACCRRDTSRSRRHPGSRGRRARSARGRAARPGGCT